MKNTLKPLGINSQIWGEKVDYGFKDILAMTKLNVL
jgi:hypothetical protein